MKMKIVLTDVHPGQQYLDVVVMGTRKQVSELQK